MKRKKLFKYFILSIVLLLQTTQVFSQNNFIGSIAQKPASNWKSGMLTGNGNMGAIVYGNPYKEEIVFNHADLFMTLGTTEIVPDMRKFYPDIKKSAIEADFHGPQIFHKLMTEKSQHKLAWTDPFHPAFSLLIKHPFPVQEYTNYSLSENFLTGEINVSWKDQEGEWNRKLFISRKDNVAVLELTGPKGKVGGDFSLSMNHPLIKIEKKTTNNELQAHVVYVKGKGGYDNVIRITPTGGHIKKEGNTLKVNGANKILLLIQIEPWKTPLPKTKSEAWAYNQDNPFFKDNHPEKVMSHIVEHFDSLNPHYKSLFLQHKIIHENLFNRVNLSLGNKKEKKNVNALQMMNESLQKKKVSPELISYLYDACRYLIICSTNEKPANLQGIWTGTWKPEWSGDYTLDSNIQLEIQSLMSCNMPELAKGYFNMIESWIPDFRLNAKKIYGCKGIVSNPRSSNTPLYLHWGKWPGELAYGCMGWMLHFFYDYYQFTGNKEFLKNHVVPLLKENVLFYEDLLKDTEDKNGKYRFYVSYSPEQDNLLYMNSTYDISIAKAILTYLIKSAKILNIEEENIPKWENMLAKMPEYKINKNGELAEWAIDKYAENYNHRHHSHLLPLYQFCEFDEENQVLWKAAIKAFEAKEKHWLDNNINPNSNHITHGLMNQAQCAARIGRGDVIEKVLHDLILNEYIYPNFMISYCPHKSGFGFDPVGTIPDVINNSLIFGWENKINILPALPKTWKQGELKDVLLREQTQVKELSWNMDKGTIKLTLHANKNRIFKFIFPQKFKQISIKKNNKFSPFISSDLKLEKGKNHTFEFTVKQ